MKPESSNIQIFDSWKIEVTKENLARKLKATGNKDKILEMADNILVKVGKVWSPRAILRWFRVLDVTENEVMLQSQKGDKPVDLRLGYSNRFLISAKQVLVGVYTVGSELEIETIRASFQKQPMDSYLFDLIELTVLEKTGQKINTLVEEMAIAMHWGVGPILSPGSVHGWELSDQGKLCSLIPIEKIGVAVDENGVLQPFKSISCLIGIGPDYEATTVGDPCQVCSKKHQCIIRNSSDNRLE